MVGRAITTRRAIQKRDHIIGMEKYIETLVENEIDVDTLATMTDLDLKEIGITTFGNICR